MLARRRIAGLCVIVGVALAVRLGAVLFLGELPPFGWLLLFAVQAAVGATIVAAVAFLAWSRLPERPVVGWLAALFAAVYPPHIWLVTAPQVGLWLALVVTVLLIPLRHRWGVRLAMLAAALAIIVGPPLVMHRVQTGSWSPASDVAEKQGDADGGDSHVVVQRLQRLGDFALFAGERDWAADRLCRLAAVALLVMAAIGFTISCPHWRALAPTYLVVAAAALAVVFGYASPSLRVLVEPTLFLWAAWSLALMLSRTAAEPAVRVYQPGEQAHDPLEPQILPGPRYAERERRRAG